MRQVGRAGRWTRVAAVLAALGAMQAVAVCAEGFNTAQYRDDRGYDRGYDRNQGYDRNRGDDRGYDRSRDDRGYDRGGGGGGGDDVPNGTYLRSCGQARRSGSTLTAICRGDRGRSYETSLDLTRCGRSDIGNNFGTLNCAGATGRSRPAN